MDPALLKIVQLETLGQALGLPVKRPPQSLPDVESPNELSCEGISAKVEDCNEGFGTRQSEKRSFSRNQIT